MCKAHSVGHTAEPPNNIVSTPNVYFTASNFFIVFYRGDSDSMKFRASGQPMLKTWKIVRGDLARRLPSAMPPHLLGLSHQGHKASTRECFKLFAIIFWCLFPQVKVITGPEKGETGVVSKVLRHLNRVVVEGLNRVRF